MFKIEKWPWQVPGQPEQPEQPGQPRESPESTALGSVFLFFAFAFFTMGIHPYTGAYTAYRTMFQKGESTRLAWFLGSRGCSGQIIFHTSVTPLIGSSGNYTPEHK